MGCHIERLAEYGWKPHRDSLARKTLSRASIYWYMREKQRGMVASNSRFQRELFQRYSINLSHMWSVSLSLRRGKQEKSLRRGKQRNQMEYRKSKDTESRTTARRKIT